MIGDAMSGVAALAWAVRLLATSPVLLAVSAVAAGSRAVAFAIGQQRLGSGGLVALEAVAGVSRLVLILAVFWVAQRRAGLPVQDAEATFAEGWRYLQEHWGRALIALGVVGLAAGAANGLLWWGGRTFVGDGSDTPAALATVYALKNMLVIPVFMIALFRVFRWVPVTAST